MAGGGMGGAALPDVGMTQGPSSLGYGPGGYPGGGAFGGGGYGSFPPNFGGGGFGGGFPLGEGGAGIYRNPGGAGDFTRSLQPQPAAPQPTGTQSPWGGQAPPPGGGGTSSPWGVSGGQWQQLTPQMLPDMQRTLQANLQQVPQSPGGPLQGWGSAGGAGGFGGQLLGGGAMGIDQVQQPGQQFGLPPSNPMAGQMNALLAQQMPQAGGQGQAAPQQPFGLPDSNPMAGQMNALLGQQMPQQQQMSMDQQPPWMNAIYAAQQQQPQGFM